MSKWRQVSIGVSILRILIIAFTTQSFVLGQRHCHNALAVGRNDWLASGCSGHYHGDSEFDGHILRQNLACFKMPFYWKCGIFFFSETRSFPFACGQNTLNSFTSSRIYYILPSPKILTVPYLKKKTNKISTPVFLSSPTEFINPNYYVVRIMLF